MAKAIDFPRHGRIKRNRKPCIIVGEGAVAGIQTLRVKFSENGPVVDYHRESVSVLGRVNPVWED